jgi:hypothetical protein
MANREPSWPTTLASFAGHNITLCSLSIPRYLATRTAFGKLGGV